MPRLLKDLQINDVSSVDRGAGVGVKVLLMKRDDSEDSTTIVDKADDNVIDLRELRQLMHKTETTPMPANEQITKQIDEAIGAAMKAHADELAKAQAEIETLKAANAFLAMPVAHQEFAKEFPPEEKKKFAEKKAEEREEQMESAKKALVTKVDPAIAKRLAEADADRIILKQLMEKDEIQTFAKRAKDLGLSEDKGELLRKAHHGDQEALKGVEEMIKSMTGALAEAQKTGKIFSEFGSATEKAGTSALDTLTAMAKELRKADKTLSEQQAFAKVYEDEANAELVKQEKAERNRRMGVAA